MVIKTAFFDILKWFMSFYFHTHLVVSYHVVIYCSNLNILLQLMLISPQKVIYKLDGLILKRMIHDFATIPYIVFSQFFSNWERNQNYPLPINSLSISHLAFSNPWPVPLYTIVSYPSLAQHFGPTVWTSDAGPVHGPDPPWVGAQSHTIHLLGSLWVLKFDSRNMAIKADTVSLPTNVWTCGEPAGQMKQLHRQHLACGLRTEHPWYRGRARGVPDGEKCGHSMLFSVTPSRYNYFMKNTAGGHKLEDLWDYCDLGWLPPSSLQKQRSKKMVCSHLCPTSLVLHQEYRFHRR